MRYLLLVLTVLVAPSPILAQSETAGNADSLYAVDPLSLQFNFVNEASAAVRWRAMGTIPLRVKVDVSGGYLDAFDDKNRSWAAGDSLTYSSDGSQSTGNWTLGLSLQYMLDLYHAGLVRVHVGIGPTVTYSVRSSSYQHRQTYPSVSHLDASYYRADAWQLGGLASLGIECRLYRNLTIFAEYHVAGTYGWSKNVSEYSNGSRSESKYSTGAIQVRAMTIGLGVYL